VEEADVSSCGDSGGHAAKRLAVALPQAPLHDRTYQTLHAAQSHVYGLLFPLIDRCAATWAGPRSEVAYGAVGGAGLTWRRVHTVAGAAEVNGWAAAVFGTRLRALRAWRETLSAEQERMPAYMLDTAFATPDSELQAMRHVLLQSAAASCSPPPDAAWIEDFQTGQVAALTIMASGDAFAARQRMESVRTFLDAAEAVLSGLCAYSASVGRALTHRLAWGASTCAALGDAAGSLAEARAPMPPLVAILRLRGDNAEGTRLLALATTPPPPGMPPPRFKLANMHM
jgi:hypothetical protein